jgi:ribosomal protein L24
MRRGDLVRIKEGCGDEGKIGIVMSADREDPRFFAKVLIDGAQVIVNFYWLEVING